MEIFQLMPGGVVGLLYKDRLVAIAGAQAIDDNTARILQIQSTIGVCRDEAERIQTGLYAGFRWRSMLVNIWAEIAKGSLFSVIEVQGVSNNTWVNENSSGASRAQIRRGYDDVAKKMGFVLQADGNW